ncbi:MAG: hypothetical protein ABFD50_22710 [Smithella sp.]
MQDDYQESSIKSIFSQQSIESICGDIFRSGKEIKALRGVVHGVRRTSNAADRRCRSGKEPFPDGN